MNFTTISFSDWLSIAGIVITFIAAVIGTVMSIRYSSSYHIKSIGYGREKWLVLEKVALGTPEKFVDSARLVLEKSSFKNAQGYLDISLTQDNGTVVIDRYSTIHSCIHALLAPGKILVQDHEHWTEKTESNQFTYSITANTLNIIPIELINKKLRSGLGHCKAIKFEFSFPENYTGPRYKTRILVLAKGIGIVACQTEYVNHSIDSYQLTSYKLHKVSELQWLPIKSVGNWWVYDIRYEVGPNTTNISE
jgi:hypothetical protein